MNDDDERLSDLGSMDGQMGILPAHPESWAYMQGWVRGFLARKNKLSKSDQS